MVMNVLKHFMISTHFYIYLAITRLSDTERNLKLNGSSAFELEENIFTWWYKYGETKNHQISSWLYSGVADY